MKYLYLILVALYAAACRGDDIAIPDKALEPALTSEELDRMNKESEPHEFQAEVHRLMDIIINSLYTHKEIFIREIISNSADALEKIRFLSVGDANVLKDNKELYVLVQADKDSKTISFTDTGVGMTKNELVNNLGTVAKSGTSTFLEAIAQGGDLNLIGQFGVGFYSAFLVADKVTVSTKHNDEDQYIWTSSADGRFTVVKDPRGNSIGRGTRVTLYLKEDATNYLEKHTLIEIVKKYSQFINFPIYVAYEETVHEEVDEDPEEQAAADDDDAVVSEEKQNKKKTIERKEIKKEHVNIRKPIWRRDKDEITKEEYKEFYQSFVKEKQLEPLNTIHFSAEGEVEFRAILFIPSKKLNNSPYESLVDKKSNIKLYARQVLVSEEAEGVLPLWMNFVVGLIDSDDLPLKVDRESVTQSKVMKVIGERVTRKILDVMRKMSSDAEDAYVEMKNMKKAKEESGEIEGQGDDITYKWSDEENEKFEEYEKTYKSYNKFWSVFGTVVKVGCLEDSVGHRNKIAKLLRFKTSKSGDRLVGLEHVKDNLVDESNIYYSSGDDEESVLNSPLLQGYLKRNHEIIIVNDATLESCLGTLDAYEGKKLVPTHKDSKLEQSEEEKAEFSKLKKYYKALTDWWKELLGSKIKDITRVQVSNRLVTDPVGVSSPLFGVSGFGEKVFKYQTFAADDLSKAGTMGKILEINPNHPLIRKMRDLHEGNPTSNELEGYAVSLSETALLASGYPLNNTVNMTKKLYKYIANDMAVDVAAPLDKIDLSNIKSDDVSEETSPDLESLADVLKNAKKEDGGAGESDVDINDEL